MKESRWLRWVGPGLVALGVAGSLATVATGAAVRAWIARACDADPSPAEAQWIEPVGLEGLAEQPWYRVDARIDRTGALEGQRLSFGLDGERGGRFLDLPPESFGAGPFGRVVLIGSDDGSASRLQVLDVARGCASLVALESDVIRRATIDPTGRTVYEMRVDRASRTDLGIWARPLDSSTPSVRVLDAVPADERFGPTFATELSWDVDGERLAVQSCGELACRTRIVDPATSQVQLIADPDLAAMIGLHGTSLVTYAACPGLPCPIIAVDVVTGLRTTLAQAGLGAVLTRANDTASVVHEVAAMTGLALSAVLIDGDERSDLGPVSEGLRLHPTANRAGDETRLPDGWVLLGPDGRLPANGPRGEVELRHVPDGSAVQFDEVAR